MRGTASESNENPHFKQASLTVSQVLAFNITIRTRNQSLSLYHSREREPQLPVYLAQMVHTKTRNLSIIRNLSNLGLQLIIANAYLLNFHALNYAYAKEIVNVMIKIF